MSADGATVPMRWLSKVTVPAHWHTLDFISDLHLQASDPDTFAAWQGYMLSTPCQALFILGDFFEVWVGDDLLDANDPAATFARACVATLAAAATHMAVFFMPGNRDFLVGQRLMAACGMQPLSDPTVLQLPAEKWLLSHGDALCLSDVAYQDFRQQVRSRSWQKAFLAQPLQQRLGIARGLRNASEQRKDSGTDWVDADPMAALKALKEHGAQHLIHGHTHQAGDHTMDDTHHRHVLSDWDANSTPARLQVLRWHRQAQDTAGGGLSRIYI